MQNNVKEKSDVMQEKSLNNNEQPAKLIFKRSIAKSLVEDYGHKIIGLKTNKNDPQKTVYVFLDSIKLRDDMQTIVKKRREYFASKKTDSEVLTMED